MPKDVGLYYSKTSRRVLIRVRGRFLKFFSKFLLSVEIFANFFYEKFFFTAVIDHFFITIFGPKNIFCPKICDQKVTKLYSEYKFCFVTKKWLNSAVKFSRATEGGGVNFTAAFSHFLITNFTWLNSAVKKSENLWLKSDQTLQWKNCDKKVTKLCSKKSKVAPFGGGGTLEKHHALGRAIWTLFT